MTFEEAKNQLEELIQDRKSFICGGDDEIYKAGEFVIITADTTIKATWKNADLKYDWTDGEYGVGVQDIQKTFAVVANSVYAERHRSPGRNIGSYCVEGSIGKLSDSLQLCPDWEYPCRRA